jgi:hypothetical protein
MPMSIRTEEYESIWRADLVRNSESLSQPSSRDEASTLISDVTQFAKPPTNRHEQTYE